VARCDPVMRRGDCATTTNPYEDEDELSLRVDWFLLLLEYAMLIASHLVHILLLGTGFVGSCHVVLALPFWFWPPGSPTSFASWFSLQDAVIHVTPCVYMQAREHGMEGCEGGWMDRESVGWQ